MHQILVDIPQFVLGATNTLTGRLTSRTGTGAATGIAGEGNFVKQADISGSLSYAIYDDDAADPTTAIASGSLTVSQVVIDTPVTSTAIWTKDTIGYNLRIDVTTGLLAPANHRMRYVVTGTQTDGSTLNAGWSGPVRSLAPT